MTAKPCTIPGCTRSLIARGWCQTHYMRHRRTGSPTGHKHRRTADERFWRRVLKTPTCWLWLGSAQTAGYGQMRLNGTMTLTHRYAYELLVGPIPAGLTLDHLCSVRLCCNPRHLEIVTLAENGRRGGIKPKNRKAKV